MQQIKNQIILFENKQKCRLRTCTFIYHRKVLPMIYKTLREDAHAEAVENVAMRRFGGAEYAFTRILSCFSFSKKKLLHLWNGYQF